MSDILDDLFSWALQQPDGNVMTVQFAMATNEMTNNLVSYARGTLTYRPPKPLAYIAAQFVSALDGIEQFFNDRLWPPPGGNNPFDPNQTDLLNVTITWTLVPDRRWIAIISSKSGLSKTVSLTFDSSTGVIYGVMDGQTFITISLCGRNSSKPSA